MPEARMRYALIAVCLACLAGSGIALYAGHRPAAPPVTITSTPETSFAAPAPPDNAANPPPQPKLVYVDVAGAVLRPSLYALPPGCRIMQAISAAGGPSAEADLDAVNLAEPVKDGEKVYVPHLQKPAPSSLTAALPNMPAFPVRESKIEKAAATAKPGKITSPDQGQIGINSATLEDLERLPGVGPAMAARILAYRQSVGSFQKIEDLRDVKGIGPKKFAKIAPLVILD